MREGSLGAPTRHAIPWQDEAFYDEADLDSELRRVFDICHGCRRCFNLCDSFPKLFDMIDESEHEDVEHLASEQLKPVIDACTLCDMCFMTKCPYVPPHDFNLDFPHLMVRARAIKHKKGETSFPDKQLAETDRNGKLFSTVPGLANIATAQGSPLRPLVQAVAGIDKNAFLPAYADGRLSRNNALIPAPNPHAPAFGKKVVLYATCYGEFNDQTPGEAAIKLLTHNGVQVRVEHPHCCGMPKFENGDLAAVAQSAQAVSSFFAPLIDDGWDVVPLTTSCALMLKLEWPLITPGDAMIEKLAQATYDLSEYIVDLAKGPGLMPIDEMPSSIAVHFACHARAQNMGAKALEMLKLIPQARPQIVERCSGHGGKWGIFKGNFETALKVGKPAARAIEKAAPDYVVSECPLAGPHLRQVLESIDSNVTPERIGHPVELMAKAYGI
ncbi:MAG: glycerol-3-phosphate dehydrogenase [Alphaproteobacteria bacterium]|nr:glycerol-3-phosphate dehydrogenase [Alphaproteobacteria bacterium]